MMARASIDLAEAMARLGEDTEFSEEYERLKPRYALIAQIINARHEKHISQEEMARLMGTTKGSITRLENGSYNPSLDFLVRAAQSLGKRLEISLA